MCVINDFASRYIGLVEVKRQLELANVGNVQYYLMKLPGWRRVSGYYFLDRKIFDKVKRFVDSQPPGFNFQTFLLSPSFNQFCKEVETTQELEAA